jgi:hypothetical protein
MEFNHSEPVSFSSLALPLLCLAAVALSFWQQQQQKLDLLASR